GFLEVRLLKEVAAHLREEEHDCAEHEEEHYDADKILHRVVRMEGNAIKRYAGFVLVLLDVHAQRVVRANLVQRQDVQHHKAKDHDWQGNHVQGEEAVQRDTGDQVITTDPTRQECNDHRQ